jgi:isopenicillin N synthase-like dioxygenase
MEYLIAAAAAGVLRRSVPADPAPGHQHLGLDRQSIPFFYDPNHDAPVEVIGT